VHKDAGWLNLAAARIVQLLPQAAGSAAALIESDGEQSAHCDHSKQPDRRKWQLRAVRQFVDE